MKPVLTVEGKQLDVYALFYREGRVHSITTIDKGGVTTVYHDTKEDMKYYVEKPLQIDFDACLVWEGLHDETVAALNKRIEAYEERVIEISQEFIAIYTDEMIVYPEQEAKSLQKEYREIMGTLEGLYEAKNIIYETQNPDDPFVESIKQMGEFLEQVFKGGESNEH